MRYSKFLPGRRTTIVLCTIIFSIGMFGVALGSARVARAAASTWTVNNLGDSGTTTCVANAGSGGPTCQLRDAMNKAASGDTIVFSVSGTITVSAKLIIAANITITGPGAAALAIDGSTLVTVFAITNSVVTASISGLTIQNGYATGGMGGGIYNNGILTVSDSILHNNSTPQYGGGIDNGNQGKLTVNNSTFFNNGAPSFGAGINNNGTLTVSNSTFYDNTTNGNGGGVGTFNATATITNSSFYGNTASGDGGGIQNDGVGTLTVSNSTISGNSAAGHGGGVNDTNGTVSLGSNIIAGNTGTNGGPDIFKNTLYAGAINTLGYNLVGDGTSDGFTPLASDQVGTTASPLNPQLTGLGSYGGPTQTFLVKPGSLAIGKGDCNLTLPVTTDQRGVARKVVGAGCDVGAFEDFSFSPITLPNAVNGVAYTQTITPGGGTAGYTFTTTLVSGSLPSGISLTSGGILTGTPSQTGAFAFTFQVRDANGNIVEWGYTLTVNSPTATPTNTPTATPTNTPTATPTNTPVPRIDSIGIYRVNNTNNSATFYLRLHNSTGNADITVPYGYVNTYPVVGDWTGAGFDTIGIYDQTNGAFKLRNSNTQGVPDETFTLGNPNDVPIAGRWDNAITHHGVGVFRPSNGLIYLKNVLTTGYADFAMVLGIPGDSGLAGDWDGNGFDSPGVYRPSNSTFYLSNKVCNCSVYADIAFAYGIGGDAPVVGDWIGQGHDGVGLFRQTNGYTYLRNPLTTGYANITFVYGIAGDIPVAGHWQLVYPPVAPPEPGSVLVPPTVVPVPVAPTGVGD